MSKAYSSKDVNFMVEHLTARLKRRQVVGSWHVATETLILLRQVISVSKWNNVRALLDDIRAIGAKLILAQPQELAVGNIIRRTLHMIREEYKVYVKELDEETPSEFNQRGLELEESNTGTSTPKLISSSNPSSLFSLMVGSQFLDEVDYSKSVYTFKPTIIEAIKELLDELVNIYSSVSAQALEHIHSNEIIMTCGKSRTVEEFLKIAARKRQFQVLVVESPIKMEAYDLAKSLAKAGIATTVIPHASTFAVMSRVNKVILGTHAVLANGGLIAVSGTQSIARAAKFHATPVVVCTGMYKISPLHPTDEEQLNVLVAPSTIASYSIGEFVDNVEVVCPYFDYVEPELVSLFITNAGGHPPSYLYRLITENYHPEDTYLENLSI